VSYKLSRYFSYLFEKGKRVSIIVWTVLIVSSGVGYVLLSKDSTKFYFEKRIPMNNQAINVVFGEKSIGEYILTQGIAEEAEKHFLRVGSEDIKRIIQNVPAFQTNGTFDEKKYAGILKTENLTPKEIRECCEAIAKKNLFMSLWNKFPLEGKMAKALKKHAFVKSTGVQIIENTEAIAVEKPNKEELNNLASEMFLRGDSLVTMSELRSGTVYSLEVSKFSENVQKKHMENITDLSENELIKYANKNGIHYLKKEYKLVMNGHDEISLALFEKKAILMHTLLKSFVTDIQGKRIKKLTPEIYSQLETLCIENKRRVIAMENATRRVEAFNKGKITKEELIGKNPTKSMVLDNQNNGDIEILIVPKSKSTMFFNYDNKVAIFLCENRQYREENIDLSFLINDEKMEKNILEAWIKKVIEYWINNAETQDI